VLQSFDFLFFIIPYGDATILIELLCSCVERDQEEDASLFFIFPPDPDVSMPTLLSLFPSASQRWYGDLFFF